MGRIQGDLATRTFEFAKHIVMLLDLLPQNTKGWVLGKQLLRAGTSIGANVREADHALTKAEFINKCSIARKEAAETEYWLRLCQATETLPNSRVLPLTKESDELTRVLGAIVKRTQENA